MESKDYSLKPKDYEGGQSLQSFHSTYQIAKDIAFITKLLPSHYTVKESVKKGSVHCKSKIGIKLNGNEDEEMWGYIFEAIKQYFGKRFQEVFHNTCYCHVDFIIYLKQL